MPFVDEGLELEPDGRPVRAVRRVVVDDWHQAPASEIAAAAACAADSLPLTVGVATRQPPPRLRPLLDALTFTLVGSHLDAAASQLVRVPDPWKEYAALAEAVARRPRAAVALGQLLRGAPPAGTLAGLAAEAATYSMLLGGEEFAAWLSTRPTPRPAVVDADRPFVRRRRTDADLWLVLDRPERRNAFGFRMREELYGALEVAALDTTVERVELAGEGPVFCSGGDLAEFGQARDLVAAYLVRLDRAPWRLLDRLRDRVTVRVQGAAVGAGIEMAAFAGRVVAAPQTFFALPEMEMGLVPGAGGTVSVPRRIGRWRAAWMMVSGARVDAGTALRWGLVDAIEDAHADRGGHAA
ncbi:enoyl-CoA hydratase/isomerase family protein [Streptomyces sp. NBC_01762]|uniref:enoyl-CoA hydratase/isomerase family protein n=1 Tax=Streptomyces sp. NBC_01762 TaxID=2975933 RepID=UPI002DDC5822|nr:enoyl-CoA hydratase/isomerase family protein [Streptomyces sp. NBC_01762]WSC49374.1 enoyl-CoA hydratase/isomerase family protein [Streptomyces sp. NBC_01762]